MSVAGVNSPLRSRSRSKGRRKVLPLISATPSPARSRSPDAVKPQPERRKRDCRQVHKSSKLILKPLVSPSVSPARTDVISPEPEPPPKSEFKKSRREDGKKKNKRTTSRRRKERDKTATKTKSARKALERDKTATRGKSAHEDARKALKVSMKVSKTAKKKNKKPRRGRGNPTYKPKSVRREKSWLKSRSRARSESVLSPISHRSTSRSGSQRSDQSHSEGSLKRRKRLAALAELQENKFSTDWNRTGLEIMIPIPERADINFLVRLCDDKQSTFTMNLYEKNAVRIQILGLKTEGKKRFVLRGPQNELSNVSRQVDELIAMPTSMHKSLLKKYEQEEVDTEKKNYWVTNEPKVSTSKMDFTKLVQQTDQKRDDFKVPQDMVSYVCTSNNKQILLEATGVEVEYISNMISLRGSKLQRARAHLMLKRVVTHCQWGISDDKVMRLLDASAAVTWALCRLSPMSNLPKYERNLTDTDNKIFIGKDKRMDLSIPNSQVSRQHCVIELDLKKKGIYLIDCSANGTFLNGKKLPSKSAGKVMLSHGDELNLMDPRENPEFGYIVNFQIN